MVVHGIKHADGNLAPRTRCILRRTHRRGSGRLARCFSKTSRCCRGGNRPSEQASATRRKKLPAINSPPLGIHFRSSLLNEAMLPLTIRPHYTTLFSVGRYANRCGFAASRGGIEVGTVRTRSGGRFFC